MRTLERYLARQIYAAVGFVFLGFLALFAFFDLIRELSDLGNGDYQLRQVFTFVLLSMPAHAYELFPIVVLIGTLYVLSHLAGNSEFTVMRGSGLSPRRAALALGKIGLAFVVATFVIVKIVDVLLGIRVNARQEELGLDVAVHGEVAYQA